MRRKKGEPPPILYLVAWPLTMSGGLGYSTTETLKDARSNRRSLIAAGAKPTKIMRYQRQGRR